MKKSEVQVGKTYRVKVSGNVVPVKITAESPYGGWDGVNTATDRPVRIKTAARLRSEDKPLTDRSGITRFAFTCPTCQKKVQPGEAAFLALPEAAFFCSKECATKARTAIKGDMSHSVLRIWLPENSTHLGDIFEITKAEQGTYTGAASMGVNGYRFEFPLPLLCQRAALAMSAYGDVVKSNT